MNSLLQDRLEKIKQFLFSTRSCSKYFISQLFPFCGKRGVKSRITTQNLFNSKLILKENPGLFQSILSFISSVMFSKGSKH